VNLSLGGTTHSNALEAAVKALVDQGVVMVIAAGNAGVDVGDATPDVDEAIVVGAMGVHDAVPCFSNFG
jgi:subtilisin family serine protease